MHLISDETLSISRAVYDLSPDKVPAHTRSANASEKDARASLSAAVKRVLSSRDIVILDGLNYIKGWRYQLFCEAKNLRTPSVVLQVGCSVERARGVNEKRLQEREARKPAGTTANPVRDDDPKEAYEPANWDNLVFRYEEPNAMSRWDSPLFTLIWEDDEVRTQEVFDSLWDAMAGEGRKAVQPNRAALQRGNDVSGDYLYVLDKETQDIVKKILEMQGDDGGVEVKWPVASSNSEVVLDLPGRKLGLPELQRYRRAYMGLNRGGIGLEGVGNLASANVRVSFVRYLNDIFAKEE